MGRPSQKKEVFMIDVQKKFLEQVKGQSYENQYRFILQTGLRTGELVGLKWENADFANRTAKIRRSMEYRHTPCLKYVRKQESIDFPCMY